MYTILKLIILLEIYASSIYECKTYVLETTQQNDNNNGVIDNKLNELGPKDDPSMYIDNMVRPADIREPTSLHEIISYVGADKLNSNTQGIPETKENLPTLTYSELTRLLSFWQWAKEHNFYDMQTEQTKTYNNYVTMN